MDRRVWRSSTFRWTVDARADERSYKAMAHALSHWVNVEDESLKAFRNAALAVSAWPQDPHPDDAMDVSLVGLNGQQQKAADAVWSRAPLTLQNVTPMKAPC